MKIKNSLGQISFGTYIILLAIVLSSAGCNETASTTDNNTVFKPHPGVAGFDWGNDPLKVSINEAVLKTDMGRDTLDLIKEDLYTYFHTMNTGDSLDWETHLTHFPLHMFNDTAMLNKQFAETVHWRDKGFLNRMGKADIKYASNWIIEEDQMVAILGYNADFYLDFLPHFEGNPAGMRFLLEDKYGRDNIIFNSSEEVNALGDTISIRNWHADAYSTIFVLKPLESMHFTFLPQGFNKANFGADLMKSETMLDLMRLAREYKKSITNGGN